MSDTGVKGDGTMTQQWTAWCARCPKWEMLSGSKRWVRMELITTMGWTKQKDGMICRECSKKPKA